MNKVSSLTLAFAYHVVQVVVICVFLSCEGKEAILKKELEEAKNKAEKFQTGFNRLEKEKKDLEEKFNKKKEENLAFDVLCTARNCYYEKEASEKKRKDLNDKKALGPLTPEENADLIELEKKPFNIPVELVKLLDDENKQFKIVLGRK